MNTIQKKEYQKLINKANKSATNFIKVLINDGLLDKTVLCNNTINENYRNNK